jgi:hypothetical protein
MWRRILFGIGGLCFVASLIFMEVGVAKAHRTTDYLEQARIAIPFIRSGLLWSAIALVFSCFGRGATRVASVVVSALLLSWWLLIAESIY